MRIVCECGQELEFEVKPIYPGTSDEVIVVDPCPENCMTDWAALFDSVVEILEHWDELKIDKTEDTATTVESCLQDLLDTIKGEMK